MKCPEAEKTKTQEGHHFPGEKGKNFLLQDKEQFKIGPNKGTANSQSNNDVKSHEAGKKTKMQLCLEQRTFTGGVLVQVNSPGNSLNS